MYYGPNHFQVGDYVVFKDGKRKIIGRLTSITDWPQPPYQSISGVFVERGKAYEGGVPTCHPTLRKALPWEGLWQRRKLPRNDEIADLLEPEFKVEGLLVAWKT